MTSIKLPPCPPQLKAVQHYLNLARDYESRQPVITYWARLYSLQTAIKIDRKSPEAKALLTSLMDWLETFKKNNTDNEAITSDVAGQALVENEGHKLFMIADTEDRAARFSKNVVKSFYTSGIIFDVCEVFGELTEEIVAQRKYAKWKATYIHNCLKKGEQPIPGPIGGEEANDDGIGWGGAAAAQPPAGAPSDGFTLPPVPGALPQNPIPPETSPEQSLNLQPQIPQPSYSQPAISQPIMPNVTVPPVNPGAQLSREDFLKAQKYCKWAISALDYEDRKTAIENVQKALTLLSTGVDPN